MAKLENKTKENPKLEQNKLSDGRISLYLEYYLGSAYSGGYPFSISGDIRSVPS